MLRGQQLQKPCISFPIFENLQSEREYKVMRISYLSTRKHEQVCVGVSALGSMQNTIFLHVMVASKLIHIFVPGYNFFSNNPKGY